MSIRGLTRAIDELPMKEVRLQTTFIGRLKEEKRNLEGRLIDVNAVLKSLEEAPEIAKVLEALNKLGY